MPFRQPSVCVPFALRDAQKERMYTTDSFSWQHASAIMLRYEMYTLRLLLIQELLADTTFRPRTNANAVSKLAESRLKVVSDPDSYIATVEVCV